MTKEINCKNCNNSEIIREFYDCIYANNTERVRDLINGYIWLKDVLQPSWIADMQFYDFDDDKREYKVYFPSGELLNLLKDYTDINEKIEYYSGIQDNASYMSSSMQNKNVVKWRYDGEVLTIEELAEKESERKIKEEEEKIKEEEEVKFAEFEVQRAAFEVQRAENEFEERKAKLQAIKAEFEYKKGKLAQQIAEVEEKLRDQKNLYEKYHILGVKVENETEETMTQREYEKLSTMGKSWFVSFMYHFICPEHNNWIRNVNTFRTGSFKTSKALSPFTHEKYLKNILESNEIRLGRNELGLSGAQIKEMARIILQRFDEIKRNPDYVNDNF